MKKFTLFSIILLMLFTSGFLSQLIAQQENALNFDGYDDYAARAQASSLIVGGTGISISCWVYPTNANSAWPNFDGMWGSGMTVQPIFISVS